MNNEAELLITDIDYDEKDDELCRKIDLAVQDSKIVQEEMEKVRQRNTLYWASGKGKEDRVHTAKSKVTVNRIFTDVETSIPILTATTPEATLLNVPNEIKENLNKALVIAFEVKYKIQQTMQKLLRNWYLGRIGVLKYRWDEENGFITEIVETKKVGFQRKATSLQNCEYVWEEMTSTAKKLKEKFPKAKEAIERYYSNNFSGKITYLEFWGGYGEWVCWKIKDRNLLLDKINNPNWDEKESKNLFKKKVFPYILMNVFNLGGDKGVYDDTSLIEEAIPIQDGVNQLEKQIIDLNEGQKRVWIFSGEAISEDKAQEVVNRTGDLGVYLDKGKPDGITVNGGKPDASLYNNLTHLLTEIDNIFGIHSTTRGERAEQETLGGRKLLQGSDVGRLDLIVRNLEQVVEEWYNAYLHMEKVYGESEGTLALESEDSKIEIPLSQLQKGLVVMVKRGTTLPTDDASRMDMAVKLAQINMINPETLFEELGYGKAKERVKALYEWLVITGKVDPRVLQMGLGGQQQENQQGQEGQSPAQLQKLQQLLADPRVQSLPPEQKQQILNQGRQILSQIKGS